MASQPGSVMASQPGSVMASQPGSVMASQPGSVMASQPGSVMASQPGSVMASQPPGSVMASQPPGSVMASQNISYPSSNACNCPVCQSSPNVSTQSRVNSVSSTFSDSPYTLSGRTTTLPYYTYHYTYNTYDTTSQKSIPVSTTQKSIDETKEKELEMDTETKEQKYKTLFDTIKSNLNITDEDKNVYSNFVYMVAPIVPIIKYIKESNVLSKL
jgi:hypothetical protein